MAISSKYISKEPDQDGYVNWEKWENDVWSSLIARQTKHIKDKACCEYIQGLKELNLPSDRIPQLYEVSEILQNKTGWEIEAVPCLINFDRFFELLASKKFPSATFIRKPEDINYLQEPDIFHEVCGHCPMLTDPYFADFTARYGRLGLQSSHKERVKLARLYWFTVEFGLIKRNHEMKIYGGGIISSIGETEHCLSDASERQPLELITTLRTPYRIDIMQPIYFYIEKFADFENLKEKDILKAVHTASELGLLEPKYPPKSA
jgi:phenylalanine-4-hydroxylase